MNKNNPVMTLGIFAHANAGKTSITEQLLYYSGVKHNIGKVDKGTTTTDNLKIEQDRGISVRSTLVTLSLDGTKVQLIDTPGHIDFSSEVERALKVLDGAILVISGVEGIEAQTHTIWNKLQENNVPTIIFVNKMDRKGADFSKTVKNLQTMLGDNIIAMQEIIILDNNNLKITLRSPENILEDLAEIDEETMKKYVYDKSFDEEWFNTKVSTLSKENKAHFVYGGSALHGIGVEKLYKEITNLLPTFKKSKSEEMSAYVYTVKHDNNFRELYIKVLQGKLSNRYEFIDKHGRKQKIRTITKIENNNRLMSKELLPGEIGIVTGIDSVSGDILGKNLPEYLSDNELKPLYTASIFAFKKEEQSELVNALRILNDEDPQLNLNINPSTKETNVSLMGRLQADILKQFLEDRFKLKTKFTDPSIIYKETPIKIGVGSCAFDRVSRVSFKVVPKPLGSGVIYKSETSTDVLFPKFQNQIVRLIDMYKKHGIYGWELNDCEIVMIDGHSDSVTSDPSHYNVAVPIALMRALKNSGTKLQEPLIEYEVSIPTEMFKEIIPALSNLGLRYENIDISKNETILPGETILSKTQNLQTDIINLTSGLGRVATKIVGYHPSDNFEAIYNKIKYLNAENEILFLAEMGVSVVHIDQMEKEEQYVR